MYVSVSGEDLVSEQTCQREEDKQEEAAAFPAGLHNYTHPTCAERTHWHPQHHQPQQQHHVRHDIGGILGGFHMDDWYSTSYVCSVYFFMSLPQNEWRWFTSIWCYNAAPPIHSCFFSLTITSTSHPLRWSSLMDICQSLDLNVLIQIAIRTTILILKTKSHRVTCNLSNLHVFLKNLWLKRQLKNIFISSSFSNPKECWNLWDFCLMQWENRCVVN